MSKKKDIPEKAAIVQRDRETYAIAPHLPGGLVTPDVLRNIADVAERYDAKAMKISSAERIVIVGLEEDKLDDAWKDLGMPPGAAIGLCVRSVKFCPGTTFCKVGLQDAVGMGLKLDEKYHGMALPSKFKIGVSGCPNTCAESPIKEIGLVGRKEGWEMWVGGRLGRKPRLGQVLTNGLSDDEALALIEKIIEYYKANAGKQRLGDYIDEIGWDAFKEAVL